MEEKVFGLPANSLANSMIIILIVISIVLLKIAKRYADFLQNAARIFLNFC